MKVFILMSLILLAFGSCKKTYTCTCKLENSTDRVFTINDSKKNAKKRCDEASNFYIETVFIAKYNCDLN